MTLEPDTGAVTLERLGPPDLIEVFGLLDRDPVLNVYVLALTLRDGLAHPKDEVLGVRRDGELTALFHLGTQSGALLPIGEDVPALELIAGHLLARLPSLPRRFQIIGPRIAANTLIDRLEAEGVRPRLRRAQTYMGLGRGALKPFERLPELRRAVREDHAIVFESGADLRAEELDEDPRAHDAAGYSRRVEEECRDGCTHLWLERDRLLFRASVSAQTADAAQVSGVFTPPPLRGRGIAKRALSELCTRLLERSRHVCLFVNDSNAPAISAYRAIGFETLAPWASAFYTG